MTTELPFENASDQEDDINSFEITRNLSNGAIFLHRIPNIPIAKARKTVKTNIETIRGGGYQQGDISSITDPDFLQFIRHIWFHPRLMATAFFAMSTVISFLRMLPYVVVSDVIGPLQISLGTMVTETLHFFLVVGVVVFSFSVGMTYIYSYYNEIDRQKCIFENGGETGCPKGKLAT